jgi:TPR repeat protein
MTRGSEQSRRGLAGALWLALALAAQPAPANEARALGESEYEVQHYAAALAAFERAGESGDLRAQELAALMHLYGNAIYGAQVPRDEKRAEVWLLRAAVQGSEVARTLLAQRLAVPCRTK